MVTDHGVLGARVLPSTSIPTIDIAPLFGTDRQAFEATAREMADACAAIGFFYIKNHGVSADLIDRTYQQAERFHNSPVELKRRIQIDKSPGAAGWLPLTGDEAPDDDTEIYRLVPAPADPVDDYLIRPRLFEAFDMWLEVPDDDPDYLAGNVLFVPNQWPDWLPGFRDDVLEYYETMRKLGDVLFRAAAVALGLPDRFFLDMAKKPPTYFRLLHYPANDRPQNRSNVGIGAHSDEGFLTILNQRVPGLQVMNAADEWVEAPPIDGTFIVNIGDLMEVWTNGMFKATRHRVVNSTRERYSLPFFATFDYDVVVAPLPQFTSADNPPLYKPVRSGPHFADSVIQFDRHLRKRLLNGDLKLDFEIEGKAQFMRKAINEYVDDTASS
jgi:isopenicillin N synthase-like dioxygenase